MLPSYPARSKVPPLPVMSSMSAMPPNFSSPVRINDAPDARSIEVESDNELPPPPLLKVPSVTLMSPVNPPSPPSMVKVPVPVFCRVPASRKRSEAIETVSPDVTSNPRVLPSSTIKLPERSFGPSTMVRVPAPDWRRLPVPRSREPAML